MFDKAYFFKGKHAKMVEDLTRKDLVNINSEIFPRVLDVYLMAPIIGFLYLRRAKPENNSEFTKRIHLEQLISETKNLEFNYRLVTLLNRNSVDDNETKINNAFRIYGDGSEIAKEHEELFDTYVLGGVEVLYERLIEKSTTSDDIIHNYYDFICELNEMYTQKVVSFAR
jgi:hypothetical protein